jgi:hypothetical protein
MRPENAAAIVGAGALSILVFPLLGDRINRAHRPAAPSPHVEDDRGSPTALSDLEG